MNHEYPFFLLALLGAALLLAACGPKGPGGEPSATHGKLAVTVSDLPTGVDAAITVSGPEGFSENLTGDSTLEELDPGEYTVSANDVSRGNSVFSAVVSGSPALVKVGETASVGVAYELFGAVMADQHVNVPFEGSREIDLSVQRSGSYAGEVTVSVDSASLPTGVSMSDTNFTVPENESSMAITITSDNTVTDLNTPTVVPVTIVAGGSTTVAELTVEVGAVVLTADNDGLHSLRYWVDGSPAGTLITFDPVVFAEPQVINLSSVITVAGDLDIEGPTNELGEPFVEVHGSMQRVFTVEAGASVSVNNLVLTGVAAPGANGGAILNQGALTLNNLHIKDSAAELGGAVYNAATGTLTLSNTQISGNTAAAHGGGIYNVAGGNLTVRSSVISMNEVTLTPGLHSGGGINNYGILLVEDSTIHGNTARSGGGISTSHGGELVILSSTISGNSVVGSGGGLFSNDEALILNSTFTGNTAGVGGGMFLSANEDAKTRIAFSTVSDNTAAGGGGGINYMRDLWLRGVIIANNKLEADATADGPDLRASGADASLVSAGYNLVGDTMNAGFTPAVGDVINQDALLAALADNGGPTRTMAPQAGSPAINAVPLADCLDVAGASLKLDQREQARPGGSLGNCDMGAFETQ